MTKSELIERLVAKYPALPTKTVEDCVKSILEQMMRSLADGTRVEVRGFGSFSLHFRQARTGRNPKTGESVQLYSKYVPHFRPGKALKERVDQHI